MKQLAIHWSDVWSDPLYFLICQDSSHPSTTHWEASRNQHAAISMSTTFSFEATRSQTELYIQHWKKSCTKHDVHPTVLRHTRLRCHLFGQVNPLFGCYPSPVGCLSLARQRALLILSNFQERTIPFWPVATWIGSLHRNVSNNILCVLCHFRYWNML